MKILTTILFVICSFNAISEEADSVKATSPKRTKVPWVHLGISGDGVAPGIGFRYMLLGASVSYMISSSLKTTAFMYDGYIFIPPRGDENTTVYASMGLSFESTGKQRLIAGGGLQFMSNTMAFGAGYHSIRGVQLLVGWRL